MAVARSIGPRVTQPILYQDSVYGTIAAIITAVSKVNGTISITTFPPNAVPDFSHTGVSYDYTGSVVGSWRYHETDVV